MVGGGSECPRARGMSGTCENYFGFLGDSIAVFFVYRKRVQNVHWLYVLKWQANYQPSYFHEPLL